MVSELLSRVRYKQGCVSCQVWFLFTFMTLLNAANFTYAICVALIDYTDKGKYVTYIWFPLFFVLFMAILLLIAIIRVWRILSQERMVLVNA